MYDEVNTVSSALLVSFILVCCLQFLHPNGSDYHRWNVPQWSLVGVVRFLQNMFQVSSPSKVRIYQQDIIDVDTGLKRTRFAPIRDLNTRSAV